MISFIKQIFGKSAQPMTLDGSSILDLRDRKNAKYRGAAINFLHTQCPEYADDEGKNNGEDFSEQLDRKRPGFLYVSVDQDGNIDGLVAGMAYKNKYTNITTVALSYFVDKGNDVKKSSKFAKYVMSEAQIKHDAEGFFVEKYKPDDSNETETENSRFTDSVCESLGAYIVPIEYRQPLNPDDNEELPMSGLLAIFPKKETGKAMSEIAISHLETFTYSYDKNLTNTGNRNSLQKYVEQLSDYESWKLFVANIKNQLFVAENKPTV